MFSLKNINTEVPLQTNKIRISGQEAWHCWVHGCILHLSMCTNVHAGVCSFINLKGENMSFLEVVSGTKLPSEATRKNEDRGRETEAAMALGTWCSFLPSHPSIHPISQGWASQPLNEETERCVPATCVTVACYPRHCSSANCLCPLLRSPRGSASREWRRFQLQFIKVSN